MAAARRLVLSGYYGFDNIGDEAVLYSIITSLKEAFPKVEIIVLSNNPEATKSLYGVQSISRWDLKEIIKTIKNSDMLISGGGSLLQDVTSGKTIPYYLAIVKIAQLYRKKVVFYSQGIGPVSKKFNRWLIKRIVNKVQSIFVRDHDSKKLLEEIGVKKQVTVAIDPVIGIKLPEGMVIKREKAVGVYIRPWKNENEILNSMLKGLVNQLKQGYKLYLIPMYYEEDAKVLEDLKEMLVEELRAEDYKEKYVDQIVFVDRKLSIEEVLNYIASMEMIVGMRLHSLIMAAALQTPMMAISYDPKVTAFMKEIDVPYCLATETINSEDFYKMLESLNGHRKEQTIHLEQVYRQKRKKVDLPIESIKELLK